MRALTIAALVLLACPPQRAVASADEALGRMEGLIQNEVSQGRFSGSVLVAKGGAIILERHYGFADFSTKIPINSRTRFQIGSTTKQFTAAAVLLLEERGELRTADRVRKYLPELPGAWDKITLMHLLTHTGGLPNYTEDPAFLEKATTARIPQEVIGWIADQPLKFEPGKKWEYSNSGYIVLGMVIERVSGKRYKAFLQENMFGPLEMLNTSYDPDSKDVSDCAAGHQVTKSGPAAIPSIHLSVAFAAGGLFSTARDMLRWQEALHGGEVLGPASLTVMTTPVDSDYATGLIVETRYWHFLKMLIRMGGTTLIHHGGATMGFANDTAFYPEQQMSVIVLGNIQSDAPATLARRLATVAFNEADWPPPATPTRRSASVSRP